MLRILLLTLSVVSFFGAKAFQILPDSLRVLYFEEWVGKCGAEKLVEYTGNFDVESSPVYMAYRGAGLATTSNCTSWPQKKIARFREGKALIEAAVARAPESLEVRFLRYSIQKNIPDFLGYDHVEEDRKFIMERLTLQLKSGQTDDLTDRILKYLYITEGLSREQIMDLKTASANH